MTSEITNFFRDAFSARTRHALRRETHVVVGDHDPEPRAELRVASSLLHASLRHPVVPRIVPRITAASIAQSNR